MQLNPHGPVAENRYALFLKTKTMKLYLFLSLLTIQVSGQNLKFIPDYNLKCALKDKGLITNDSLDINKAQKIYELELNGKGIEDLNGLQYFKNLSAIRNIQK